MNRTKFFRHVQLGIKNLLLHKLRSLLTMLGVVFGVGSVVAMLAVGEGASREALEQIRRLGSNNILLKSVKPTDDEKIGQKRSYMSIYGLLYEDEQRIRETMDAVKWTVPVRINRQKARVRGAAVELRVVGTTSLWFETVQRAIVAGRVLTADDMADTAHVVVLTEHGARKLLANSHTIGQPVRIGDNHYEVVGIVQSDAGTEGAVESPDSDVDAYLPLTTCHAHYGEVNVQRTTGSYQREKVELHQILVQVEDRELVEATAHAITQMLERFHPKVDYQVRVPLALLRQAEATKRRFNIVLGSIAGISLLVGGIGIMNIMLASVTERTREIGIRRAIGAKRKHVIGQFLVETIVLSTLGGLAGISMGIFIPYLISAFAGMPTVVPLYSVVLSLGISICVGVIFGVYPAIRAANVDPIVALRHE